MTDPLPLDRPIPLTDRAHWLSLRHQKLSEAIDEVNETYDNVIAGIEQQRQAELAGLLAEQAERADELKAWQTARVKEGARATVHLAGATLTTTTPRRPVPVWRDELVTVNFLLDQGADDHVRTTYKLDKAIVKADLARSAEAKEMTGPGDYVKDVIPGVDLEWRAPSTSIKAPKGIQ